VAASVVREAEGRLRSLTEAGPAAFRFNPDIDSEKNTIALIAKDSVSISRSKVIIVLTHNGTTAVQVAKGHPDAAIIAICHSTTVLSQL
jgi:pyruvate kinase